MGPVSSHQFKKVSVSERADTALSRPSAFHLLFWCNLSTPSTAISDVTLFPNSAGHNGKVSYSNIPLEFGVHKFLNIFTYICMGLFCFHLHDEWLFHSGPFSNEILPPVKFFQAANVLPGSVHF